MNKRRDTVGAVSFRFNYLQPNNLQIFPSPVTDPFVQLTRDTMFFYGSSSTSTFRCFDVLCVFKSCCWCFGSIGLKGFNLLSRFGLSTNSASFPNPVIWSGIHWKQFNTTALEIGDLFCRRWIYCLIQGERLFLGSFINNPFESQELFDPLLMWSSLSNSSHSELTLAFCQ